MPSTLDVSEPGEPQTHVAAQLRDQARSCRVMGSPLYDQLLTSAADDVEAGGPLWQVLSDHVLPGRGDALALRFMAAVHRLVLTGRAPELARHYPSAGGDSELPGAWDSFRLVVEDNMDGLRELTSLPCQTNEVGRCAGLSGGFLHLVRRYGLPLRLLEVGASAGLNLRWDRYRYGGGGAAWGPEDSPVDLSGHWSDPPPDTDVAVEIIERRGCDPQPIDPASDEGRLALRSSVWPDQRDRLERLDGALEVALRIPVTVAQASVETWLADELAERRDGLLTVVFHSVVDEYLADDVRDQFHAVLGAAGSTATATAPLAWLRLEPVTMLRSHGITLTTWPGGRQRLLATCKAHGTEVRWR